jgi:uncharacterized membrane protein YdjX (TVP38/TMEM64 family)
MSRPAFFRLVAFALVVVVLFLLANLLPLKEPLRSFLSWVQGLGIWGLVFLGGFYIPASVLLVPGTLVTLAGGALFGFWETIVAISLGSTAGACVAFLVGRGIARPWVEQQVGSSPKFQAIDRAIGEQGFKIVLLLRLSPVFPFNLLNYALSLTRVTFRDYFLATWPGMLPGTIMYVYLGSTFANVAEAVSGETKESIEMQIFKYVGLVVTVVATVFIAWVAKKALNRAIAEANPPAQPSTTGEHHV